MKIEIVTVPLGPAPYEVKQGWVGVQMDAVPMLAEGFAGVPTEEVDFISMKRMDSRGGWVVDRDAALAALEQRSPQAAAWFREHLPPSVTNLSFGHDEAIKVAA